MAQYKQFVAKEPIITEQKIIEGGTYDKYWLKSLVISAPDPIKPVHVSAVFAPAKDETIQVQQIGPYGPVVDPAGDPVMEDVVIKKLQPFGIEKRVTVKDIFTAAEQKLEIKEALEKLLIALYNIGLEQNIFQESE